MYKINFLKDVIAQRRSRNKRNRTVKFLFSAILLAFCFLLAISGFLYLSTSYDHSNAIDNYETMKKKYDKFKKDNTLFSKEKYSQYYQYQKKRIFISDVLEILGENFTKNMAINKIDYFDKDFIIGINILSDQSQSVILGEIANYKNSLASNATLKNYLKDKDSNSISIESPAILVSDHIDGKKGVWYFSLKITFRKNCFYEK